MGEITKPCGGESSSNCSHKAALSMDQRATVPHTKGHQGEGDRQTISLPAQDVSGLNRHVQTARTGCQKATESRGVNQLIQHEVRLTDNDPSAGSPTETLLRLLLPLNATVWSSSRQPSRVILHANSPRTSLKRSIGSSDGRCVQRAGT